MSITLHRNPALLAIATSNALNRADRRKIEAECEVYREALNLIARYTTDQTSREIVDRAFEKAAELRKGQTS